MSFATLITVLIALFIKLACAQNGAGTATYYSQDGAAGSCGEYHTDDDYIVALPYTWGHNEFCGQNIYIENTATGAFIWARIADTCPGCAGENIDLSMGAYEALNDCQLSLNPFHVTYSIS